LVPFEQALFKLRTYSRHATERKDLQLRKAVLDAVIMGLDKKYPSKSWTAAILSKEIAKYSNVNDKSQYEPYCQFIIFWLNK
jgi:hypothetical protein